MRIGPLASLSFQRYDRSTQRDLVGKHVPGYLQVQYYDLTSEDNMIAISGTIIGTSNANLILQCQQLTAMYRQKRVIWIDASDQYAGKLDLCRITKLTGPTIDSTTGPLIATFSLQAISLPPWGTTHANPFNETGIVFRDLDGRVLGNEVNPLDNNCNFTASPAGGPFTSFSWEFIVDNQAPFTNTTSYQWALGNSLGTSPGSSSAPYLTSGVFNNAVTISIDSFNPPNSGYSASAKGTRSSPVASTYYDIEYEFGTSGVSISGYDRLRLWFKCDQAGQAAYIARIQDTVGNWRVYNFTLQAASIWQQVIVNTAVYSSQSTAAPNFSAIQYIGVVVETGASAPSEISFWLADIRSEVGYVNHCEDTSLWQTYFQGTGTTLSLDGLIFKNSYFGPGAATLPWSATKETSTLSSIKAVGTSTTGVGYSVGFNLPVNNWNLTAYEFLVFWIRSDFGGKSTGSWQVYLGDSSGTNYYTWNFGGVFVNANQWYRLVVPLSGPTSTHGSPSLTSIAHVEFYANNGNASTTTTLWLDEVVFDHSNPIFLECHVPDSLLQTGAAITVQSWNGSSYVGFISWEPFNSVYYQNSSPYNLSGIQQAGYNGYGGFAEASIGDTVIAASGGNPFFNGGGPITYSTTYGCKSRIGFGFQVAPATSDSNSGNFPSDDLSGFQAISKVRLLAKVYITSEDTPYSGM